MKKRIAEELVELLNDHSLDRISVKELSERCGISRQTFYHYFHDIYEVVEWIFATASESILREFTDLDTWLSGYVVMTQWIRNHKVLVMKCCSSLRKDYVENFMNQLLYVYIDKVVHDEAKGMNVTEKQKSFIARFYTYAIIAVSLEWITGGMRETPEEMAGQIDLMTRGDLNRSLRNFEQQNQKKS